MFVVALGLLGDRHLAEEAVQDALVKVWRGAAGFDVEREVTPWLYQIVRRCAADVHRRHRWSGIASLDDLPARLEMAEEAPADRIVESKVIRSALEELEPPHREVVELVYFAGLSQRAAADSLGVPLGTVKSRLARAHRRLAALLSAAGVREHAPQTDRISA